jgi:hypothetical protein
LPSTYAPKHLGSIDYVANAKKTLGIDRDGVLMQLNFALSFTITNGGSAAVGPKFNALARLLKRIEINMGGRDTVMSVSGEMLASLARIDYGVGAYGVDDTVVLTGSAVTSYSIVLPLPMWLPFGRRPDDTGLDLARVRQATIAVTWGDIDDIYTTANSAALSAVNLDVEAEYLLDPKAKDGNRPYYMVRQLDEITKEVTATSSAFSITLDGQTGLLFRNLLFVATDADVGDDDVIADIEVKAGSFSWGERKEAALKAGLRHERGISSLETGVYFYPQNKWGELAQLVDTGNLGSDLRAEIDATKGSGTTNITVLRETVRPLKVAA